MWYEVATQENLQKKKDKYPCKQTNAVFDDVDAVDDDDESMNE